MTTIGRALVRWLPRPAVVALALLGIGVGAAIVVRPFRSLALLVAIVAVAFVLTGAAAAAHADREDRLTRGAGLAWAVVGVAVVAWPWPTARRLAVVVSVALVVAGVLRAAAALRSDRPGALRASAILQGATLVIAGVLASAWPDVAVLAIALGGAVASIVVGAAILRLGWRGPLSARPDPRRRDRDGRRPWRLAASALLLVGTVAAAVGTLIARPDGELDDFYDRPFDVPAEPGTLLRAEPFESSIPDGATAWRILYTTVGARDATAVASGLVVVPDDVDSTEPPPVVAWAHGTTGAARHCAPSAMPDPWSPGAFFLLDEVLERGWALVATDYVGLGAEGEPHPYLVGEPAARSVLDAVRAARQLDQAALGDQTVVWGHSQGGGAALWTGQVAPTYAPEVPLAGVAALAPASDLTGLMDALEDVSGGSIFAGYAVDGFAAAYDDVAVDDVVRPVGRVTVDEAGDRCLDASALVSIVSSLVVGMDVFVTDPTAGALGERMAENVPRGPIDAPLLVAQGTDDSLVLASMQQRYVTALCASGQAVDHREYEGRGHVPLVEADSPLVPDLLDWTRDRFDGAAATHSCDLDDDR